MSTDIVDKMIKYKPIWRLGWTGAYGSKSSPKNRSLHVTNMDMDLYNLSSELTNYHGLCLYNPKGHIFSELEQLECLLSEDTTSWLPMLLSHLGSQVKRRQSQSYKFKEFAKILPFWVLKQTLHVLYFTFWNCSIWCANMKWIPWVLLKIQSRHDSVHRQTDEVKPVNPSFNFV